MTIKDWAKTAANQVENIQFYSGERYDLTHIDRQLNFI
ncbi:hypothetical protein [Acinetobacter sp. TGL-Y2]|nr:hypothetical protein [Acinetobacter sp. TGL-Y2]